LTVQGLTKLDIERLQSDPSPQNKAATMLRVGETYATQTLSPDERFIALSIINAVLPLAEIDIRRQLAEFLKSAPGLNRDLARRLAEDTIEVARPILAESLALTDADLLAIISERSIEHARAIAGRRHLSAALTGALIRTDDEIVVLRVAANDNAEISAAGFNRMLDRFVDHSEIVGSIVQRRVLPLSLVERLTSIVSGRVLEKLIAKYELAPLRVSHLIEHGRENLLLTSFAPGQKAEEMRDLIERLHENKLLSSTLLLRALALGNFAFAVPALGIMLGIQVGNVRTLLGDESDQGAAKLFERAGLDPAGKDLFLKLAALSRSERVRRFGFAPDGWLESVRPLLDEIIGASDPDQSFDQRITEALMTLGVRNGAQVPHQT
jgi:uncharacterized protein (DUF2336 family)